MNINTSEIIAKFNKEQPPVLFYHMLTLPIYLGVAYLINEYVPYGIYIIFALIVYRINSIERAQTLQALQLNKVFQEHDKSINKKQNMEEI